MLNSSVPQLLHLGNGADNAWQAEPWLPGKFTGVVAALPVDHHFPQAEGMTHYCHQRKQKVFHKLWLSQETKVELADVLRPPYPRQPGWAGPEPPMPPEHWAPGWWKGPSWDPFLEHNISRTISTTESGFRGSWRRQMRLCLACIRWRTGNDTSVWLKHGAALARDQVWGQSQLTNL